jgi:hypothetical protein
MIGKDPDLLEEDSRDFTRIGSLMFASEGLEKIRAFSKKISEIIFG